MSENFAVSESRRWEKLSEFGILDTAPESAFDDLAHLAAQLADTPIATVTFIDRDRQSVVHEFKEKAEKGMDITVP